MCLERKCRGKFGFTLNSQPMVAVGKASVMLTSLLSNIAFSYMTICLFCVLIFDIIDTLPVEAHYSWNAFALVVLSLSEFFFL